jgi:phage-related protein
MSDSDDGVPLEPIGSSLDDLAEMPAEVRRAFGGALRMTQLGERPEDARPFGEGLPREVMKLVFQHDTDTYRMAFSWSLSGAVYLLDVFKKKWTSGRATPIKDLRRVGSRWKTAQAHHQRYYGN